MCEIIFPIFIFAISNERTFELGDRINYYGFYFRDSVYSPRNRENKNLAKISRYTVSQDFNTGDMTFQGCKGRRQCDSCIPVISVLIDLPLHTCI